MKKIKSTMLLCASMSFLVLGAGYYLSEARAQRAAVQQRSVAAQRSKDRRQWRPATYRGLTLGTSTYADVLRVLGDPQWAGPPGDQEEDEPDPVIMYEYENGGELSGGLTAWIDERSGILKSISLSPDELDKAEVIKHFGPDYIITRYDFDLCLGDEESAPIYESPNGPLLRLEYRHLGISVCIRDNGKVGEISYVSEPLGAPSSKCKPPRNKVSADRTKMVRAQVISDEVKRSFAELNPIKIDVDADGRPETIQPSVYTVTQRRAKGVPIRKPAIQHWIAFDLITNSGRRIPSFFKYQYGTSEADYWVYALVSAGDINRDGRTDLLFYSGDDTTDETITLMSRGDRFVVHSRKSTTSDY